MKLLITGSTGMVGKNLLEHPKAKDYQLVTPPHRELDLLDSSHVLKYLDYHQPDVIVHAAGIVGGIQANLAHPVKYLVENLQMGINLIMAAKTLGVPRLLNLGSSCMYPKDAKNPLKEDYVLKGQLEPTNEGYALAKSAVAKLCEYIQREDPTRLFKTAIPCNLYGRWDKFDPKNSHMLPAVIRKIDEAKESNDTVEIWGDGTARREFIYAGDMADFIFYALENFEKMPTYLNVGQGCDLSINDYYTEIGNCIGFTGKYKHDLSKPVGMKQKVTDTTVLNEFGWTPSTSLVEGIALTYKFFKEKECSNTR